MREKPPDKLLLEAEKKQFSNFSEKGTVIQTLVNEASTDALRIIADDVE